MTLSSFPIGVGYSIRKPFRNRKLTAGLHWKENPMNLPDDLVSALEPLFKILPLNRSMPDLVVLQPPDETLVRTVEALLEDRALKTNPHLVAGLWLYVDDLDRSHKVSQGIEDATGSFWHGIMHRREGDFSNSHYWFHRVGPHPVLEKVSGYDPHAFIDQVEARRNGNPPDLVDLQRDEWAALFEWCANR
jgi:hypothetical protein